MMLRKDPKHDAEIARRFGPLIDEAICRQSAGLDRYPHRNAALGRMNTAEEAEFLTQPGSGF